MPDNIIGFTLITFLHNFFTAVWIGGMFTLALSVFPATKKSLGPGPQTKKLVKSIQEKHSLWVYISMAGLVLTGLLMSNRSSEFGRLFSFQNAFSSALTVKHILVIIMILIALYRSLVLGRGKGPSSPEQEKLNARLLITNIVLGIAVLLVSGLTAAWA